VLKQLWLTHPQMPFYGTPHSSSSFPSTFRFSESRLLRFIGHVRAQPEQFLLDLSRNVQVLVQVVIGSVGGGVDIPE
jgi:hypothetical protein